MVCVSPFVSVRPAPECFLLGMGCWMVGWLVGWLAGWLDWIGWPITGCVNVSRQKGSIQ